MNDNYLEQEKNELETSCSNGASSYITENKIRRIIIISLSLSLSLSRSLSLK